MGGRILYLDYAKVIVAYLVVFYHLVCSDFSSRMYVYAFHMHFFFLISGMLHKYTGRIEWKKYIRTIGVPLVTFNLLFFLFGIFFYHFEIWNYEGKYWIQCPSDFVEQVIHTIKVVCWSLLYGSGAGLPDGPSWFLFALFGCKVLTDLLSRNRNKKFFYMCVLLIGLIAYRIHYLFIAQTLLALPFYYFGYLYRENIHNIMNKVNLYVGFAVCLLCSVILTYFNGRVSYAGLVMGDYGQYSAPLFFLNVFFGSMAVLFLSKLGNDSQFITSVSKSLISILLLQCLFIYSFKGVIGEITEWSIVNAVLLFSLSAFICLCCHWMHQFFHKYMPFMYGVSKK